MKVSFIRTLLLSSAILLLTAKAGKLDFEYKLTSGQASCFLEYMGEGVQGKSQIILLEIRVTRVFNSQQLSNSTLLGKEMN